MGVCLLYYLAVVNIIAFMMYGIDKLKAKMGKWRIPEYALFLPAIVGGSIGAWLGIKVWHHKTRHNVFRYGIPLILALQIGLFVYFRVWPAFE